MSVTFNTFSVEEKILAQAILSDYLKGVMSVGLVNMRWAMRAFAPNDEGVKSLKRFMTYVSDKQIQNGSDLASAGVPQEMWIEAPVSKSVFQSMNQDKKTVIRNLFDELNDTLGEFKFIGVQVMMNIWNNKLAR